MKSNSLHSYSRVFVALLSAVLCLGLLAGCDDGVTTDRDYSIPVRKGMTWTWRPAPNTSAAQNTGTGDNRPVISRDVIGSQRNAPPSQQQPQPDPAIFNDIVRNRIKSVIEQQLAAKGLVQVPNTGQADFIVDYHMAVQGRRERVATPAYPYSMYCGFYGCWAGGGWGYWGPGPVVVQTLHYREGTMVINIVRQNYMGTDRLAYTAMSQKVVKKNTYSQDEVTEAVKRLLKDLKPTKK